MLIETCLQQTAFALAAVQQQVWQRFGDMTSTQTPAQEREHFFKLLYGFYTAMLITHADADRLRARWR